jgi:hypothetical protein
MRALAHVLLAAAIAGCDGTSTCETGASECPCYGNGTCNAGLECVGGRCAPGGDGGLPPDLLTASLIVHPSDSVSLDVSGEVQVRAEVRSQSGALLMSTLAQPIIVRFEVADESIATVEEDGVLRPLVAGSTTLIARLEGTTTSVSVPIVVESSATRAITLDPAAAAIDVGGARSFDVSAIDSSGAPTGLTCTPALSYASSLIEATALSTPGDESIEVRGLAQGTTVLELRCGDIDATPAIVEVKPAVRIPSPAPSGDADFGYAPSLVLDSSRVHIASFDGASSKLVYTAFDGAWQSETLDGEGVYGRSSAVVLDPLSAGRPILCADENDGLACWSLAADGFWTRQRVPGTSGVQPERLRAAVSEGGVVYVAYRAAGRRALEVAVSRAGARDDWSVVGLIGELDSDFDMVLGPDGLPRFAIQRGTELYYVSVDGDLGVSTEVVDAEMTAPSSVRLAIGRDNRPQLVYLKNGNLVHAMRSTGEWRTAVVETVDAAAGSLTLDVDRYGQPRVAYVDARDQMLRYAYRLRSRRIGSPNRWRIETPEAGQVGTADSELVIDPFDRAHIVYYRAGQVDYWVEPYGLDYSDPLAVIGEDPSNTVVVEAGTPGPTGLHVSVSGTGEPDGSTVVLTWDPVPGADSYRVHHRLGGSPTRADPFYEASTAVLELPAIPPPGATWFAVSAFVDGAPTRLSAAVELVVLTERITSLSGLSEGAPVGFDGTALHYTTMSATSIDIHSLDPATLEESTFPWDTEDTGGPGSLVLTTTRGTYVFGALTGSYYYAVVGGAAWRRGYASGLPGPPVMGAEASGTVHLWAHTGWHACGTRACPTLERVRCAATPDGASMTCASTGDPGDGFDAIAVRRSLSGLRVEALPAVLPCVVDADCPIAYCSPEDGRCAATSDYMSVVPGVGRTAPVVDGRAYFGASSDGSGALRLIRCDLATGAYDSPSLAGAGPTDADWTLPMLVVADRAHIAHPSTSPSVSYQLSSFDPGASSWTTRGPVIATMPDVCLVSSGSVYCLRGAALLRVATDAL